MFQDLESQVLNSELSRLGNMELQNNVTFQNLACQVLNKKVIYVRNWFAKS